MRKHFTDLYEAIQEDENLSLPKSSGTKQQNTTTVTSGKVKTIINNLNNKKCIGTKQVTNELLSIA